MALKFRRHDLVLLPDGSEGKVLDILNTGDLNVCKVQRGEQVDYFDEGMLRLKRRFLLKVLLSFFNY